MVGKAKATIQQGYLPTATSKSEVSKVLRDAAGKNIGLVHMHVRTCKLMSVQCASTVVVGFPDVANPAGAAWGRAWDV